jgi:hypothetical protein
VIAQSGAGEFDLTVLASHAMQGIENEDMIDCTALKKPSTACASLLTRSVARPVHVRIVEQG